MSNELQNIKNRFGIIGNFPALNRALEKSIQVAPTDISVLVIGESGVGKEFIPKIIHSESRRKHQPYIVVNCGAIPEGTIDSELFGHEKGAFTGATATRKGYFEVADGGTIFLDEVGELPLQTQVRLLRVLESGEFMKVGSSQVQKTNVRIVAATNVNMMKAIHDGRFREDLYYRLNTVQIDMPPLRERKGDIHLLFRKFAIDFAEKYRMPELELEPSAVHYIENYSFPGNIRQLRNLVEQMTVVERNRNITAEKLAEYIPMETHLPMVVNNQNTPKQNDFGSEREIMYKILFDMRNDINDLKSLTSELIKNRGAGDLSNQEKNLINRIYTPESQPQVSQGSLLYFENNNDTQTVQNPTIISTQDDSYEDIEDIEVEENKPESLSLQNNEKDLIVKALEKHKGRRNRAADELGISQRTLYRKIKQYNLED
ncbi:MULTISPECIES: sigma-54 interaction domain-containing protein [Chryseobacterium]|jgi:transcriptional regulator with PAS, ATPase and Fis domain|uniref:Sigma-54-dependent Fis family transcriptional regulator n=1 Tax=Chryseobacterium rhizosphaerae TaxID=395937 RepID=A0AAE3YAA1_9FLAO|nr:MULTISPECIES: sigma-54 dependent transcriptional regulator [Chryseobacterium]MBL3548574.1 sigma-54-dependent Fis family transcriptional regulator [Chryseobacterium sp. KMC2]MDC8102730.1 sigma-54 dependent transcriptional regulator [Chryseobacterium rhizosphaerae]MDR6526466.1 transcriptional regulator with PAS, ATPase and Fis domain [Chryseobacterium rhizosphaerae]MDR6546035.1 transcriptional regulator with PAS, ATPase and Fis domain [Chryseobacterium rhizosphaerae]REC77731.1 sigma-54-depend